MKKSTKALALAALLIAVSTDLPAAEKTNCRLSDIKISYFDFEFDNVCRNRECFYMKGVATLENDCAEPVGVEIKVIGYGKDGRPIAVDSAWPNSTSNINPGEFVFSLDQWLDYDPRIESLKVQAVRLQKW